MQILCRRCASSLAARSGMQTTKSRDPVREMLSRRRSAADATEELPEKPRKAVVGIRELVRARSADFKSELTSLTPDEFVQTSMQSRLRTRFHGESAKTLLEGANESPQMQADFLAKCLIADPNEIVDTDNDSQEFQWEGTTAMDDYVAQMELNPGDLVEYWPDAGQRMTCLILRLPGKNSGKRYLTLSDRGKLHYTNPNRYRFIIPGFGGDLTHLSEGLMLQSDGALAPLRRSLKSFKEETERIGSEHLKQLNSIYTSLPESARRTSTILSVADVCKILFGTAEQTSMYAVFTAMTIDRLHFIPDPVAHLSVPVFTTRPEAEVNSISSVTHWTRTRSPQYLGFIRRAKEIAAFGDRVVADVSATLSAVESTDKFSPDDQVFVEFMMNACLERADTTENEIYTIPLSTIIKDLGFFPDEKAQRSIVHASLKKIGILTPWDSNLRRLRSAGLPGYGASAEADEQEAYMAARFGQNQVESLSTLGLRDRTESLRHDFGMLPVYAIDGDGASELDDGLSVEGDWIHVHIADPSSFIRHDSEIGNIARSRVETSYLGDKMFPMLPIHLAMRHFSLGGSNGPTPAMTTSVRLDHQGNILETLIRPSVVRNVIKTTYNLVDSEVFQISSKSYLVSSLSINWKPEFEHNQTKRALQPLTAEDCQTIRKIRQALKRAHKYRFDRDMFEWYSADRTTLLQPQELPMSPTDYSSPVFYRGRPAILTTVESQSLSPARSLVSEAAILANRAVAQFCSERRIPVFFRTMRMHLTEQERITLLGQRDSTGRIQIESLLPVLSKFGSAKLSLTPGPADTLGLPLGYTNATSPLRRYTDMVAQWQIQRFLMKEPFELNLKSILPSIIRKGQAFKRISKVSSKHWVLQLLQQKMEAGESLDFEATILQNNPQIHRPSEAMLQGVGEKCLVMRNGRDPLMPPGTTVPVRVETLDLMDNVIYTRRTDI